MPETPATHSRELTLDDENAPDLTELAPTSNLRAKLMRRLRGYVPEKVERLTINSIAAVAGTLLGLPTDPLAGVVVGLALAEGLPAFSSSLAGRKYRRLYAHLNAMLDPDEVDQLRRALESGQARADFAENLTKLQAGLPIRCLAATHITLCLGANEAEEEQWFYRRLFNYFQTVTDDREFALVAEIVRNFANDPEYAAGASLGLMNQTDGSRYIRTGNEDAHTPIAVDGWRDGEIRRMTDNMESGPIAGSRISSRDGSGVLTRIGLEKRHLQVLHEILSRASAATAERP